MIDPNHRHNGHSSRERLVSEQRESACLLLSRALSPPLSSFCLASSLFREKRRKRRLEKEEDSPLFSPTKEPSQPKTVSQPVQPHTHVASFVRRYRTRPRSRGCSTGAARAADEHLCPMQPWRGCGV